MTETERLYRQIAQALTELTEGYTELLKGSQDLQQLIVKNDAQQIGELVKEQREKAAELKHVEERRVGVVSELAHLMNWEEDGLTIIKLADLAGSPWDTLLRERGKSLTEVIEKQQMLNAQNQELLELHFEYMNFVIDNFLREPQVNNIYGSTGQLVGEEDLNGHLDNEV